MATIYRNQPTTSTDRRYTASCLDMGKSQQIATGGEERSGCRDTGRRRPRHPRHASDAYEEQRWPIELPDPIEAIRFRLEQQGKDARVLIGVIGNRSRVYEVMRGRRALSLRMIRALHEKLGIPAEVLIRPVKRRRAA